MCIMIYKPAGTRLTKQELERCWDNNPDGGAIMFLTKGGAFNIKRSMEKGPWVKHALRHMDKTLWIHARFTTRGANTLKNTHPFWMNQAKTHLCMMNGTVKGLPDEDDRSDTRIFCEEILPSLPEGWLDNPSLFELVRGYIHTEGSTFSTKMMFIDRTGRTWIINENYGHWHDGAWFSNDWYKKDRKAKTTYTSYSWDDYSGTGTSTSYEKGKIWHTGKGKYVWPNELPKTDGRYDPKFKPPKTEHKNVSTSAKSNASTSTSTRKKEPKEDKETVLVDAQGNDLITDIDCLYCGVPLLGETVEQMEKLCCPTCEADQELAAKELINMKDMTADELRYLDLSSKPFNSLSDEDYKFMSQFELEQVQGL